MNVGFIGLGRMGAGMAISLLKAGHKVTVYNRTLAKAEAFTAHGARVANDISGACGGDAVLTMLANDEAVENVVLARGGIVEHLAPDAIHISSSTVSVALSERLARAHADAGQRFVAAPVFGRSEVAEVGNLFSAWNGPVDPCCASGAGIQGALCSRQRWSGRAVRNTTERRPRAADCPLRF